MNIECKDLLYFICCLSSKVVKLSLTLRDGQRLRVSENKILRKIFGAEIDQNTGEWRRLHNFSPDIIGMTEMSRTCTLGDIQKCIQNFS